ncbi:MAG: PAS domain S-box protein, partial [bacterium]|nr:PAS domain S-box protein [bacterium]
NLIRKSIELSDFKREFEDKNYELELFRNELDKQNVNLIKKSIELSFAMRQIEDTNYDLKSSKTDLENILAELRKSEQRFKDLANMLPEVVFEVDNTGTFTFVNHGALELFGYTQKDIEKGLNVFQTYIPEDHDKLVDFQERIVNNGKTESIELTALKKDRSTFPILVYSNSVIKDDQFVGSRGFAIDMTKIKKAEETLRESEEKYRDLFENATDLIQSVDSSGNFIYVNRKWLETLKYSEDDIIGSGFTEILRKDQIPHCKDIFERVSNGESLEAIETVFIARDGSEIVVEGNINAQIKDGKFYASRGIFRDITRRKQAEEALRESEEKFRSLTENINVGIYRTTCESDGKLVEANPALIKMLGYNNKEELMNVNISDLYQDSENRKLFINEILKKDSIFYKEINLKRKDGSVIICSDSAVLFEDKKSGEKYFDGILEDITERVQAEEALQEKQQLNELLLNSLPHATMLINKNRVVIAANKLALDVGTKIGDYCWKEFAGCKGLSDENRKRAKKMQSTKGIKCEFCLAELCLSSNKLANDPEVFIFDRYWDTYWVPIDKDNFLHYAIDITERKQLEEQLQIRQRMDSLGTLAGGIAHDFNNILVGIMGNLNLLSLDNENYTALQENRLNNALVSSERAANLIRQFQTLSKGVVIRKTIVDIYDVSTEILSLLKETTDRLVDKQIEFEKGEFYVTADPGELHQVLLNLATNSAHAIEERGAKKGDFIRIKAEGYEVKTDDITGLDGKDYIHIYFEDNGAGMSEEIVKKAYDPMFTTKEMGAKKGQGLGLAMVYNIVTRIYKGNIHIESEEGKGTTIHIYLPRTRRPDSQDEEEMTIELMRGTETILIVDDEPLVMELAEDLLTRIGYTVITASGGIEALEIYEKQKDTIGVVILDLAMPQMSGQQVYKKMSEINPDIKVIICSGHDDEYITGGILSHAKGRVDKPYTVVEMAQEVRNVLDL